MVFNQLHLEYCASVLVRLLSELSNKLEFTNAFSIKMVINLHIVMTITDTHKL